MDLLTSEDCREIDQYAIQNLGFPSLILMENAGRSCADWIFTKFPEYEVIIGAGQGNNGGDGFVIARHLQLFEMPCRIVFLGDSEKLTPDAKVNFDLCDRLGIEWVRSTDESDWFRPFNSVGSLNRMQKSVSRPRIIVDAILGTGAKGDPRSPGRDFILAANQLDAIRVAIDVPSGLDANSGRANQPTFRADHTLTFIGEKTGFPDARNETGVVHLLSIGLATEWIEAAKTKMNASKSVDA